MKKDIHPKYEDITISCACGEVIKTRGTKSDIHVEVCSQCHPFFTGKQKFLDADGRIEKFRKKYAKKAPTKKVETPLGEAKTEEPKAEEKPE